MSKKEKVSLIRSDEFEAVDLELTDALARLEEANTKVTTLLQGETESPQPAAEPAEAAPSTVAEAAEETSTASN